MYGGHASQRCACGQFSLARDNPGLDTDKRDKADPRLIQISALPQAAFYSDVIPAREEQL
ncbi:MAG: hypothetical protein CMN81_03945 [Spongiibacter sp.]|nr:hypothetical protein [Spongiibacter sp.]